MASTVNIKKSRFINLVANVTSGALAFRKYANVLIDDCEFINVSSSKNGGAIFADMFIDGAHDGVMVINNTRFINCSSMFGGAIVQLGESLNIMDSSFTSNHAYYDGGAIYVSSTTTLINNCEFNNNSVYLHPNYQSFGGAIYCDLSNLTLLNSKFVNNMALDGGVVFMYDSKYLISIVEFSGNNNSAICSYFDKENSILGKLSGSDKINKSDIGKTPYPNVVKGTGMGVVLVNQTNITDIPSVYLV